MKQQVTPQIPNPIPFISDEQLAKMAEKIRPVHRKRDENGEHSGKGALHFIEIPKDIRGMSHTFGPQWQEPVPDKALKPMETIFTYHSCGYHQLLKPSVAEVFAQIPAHLVDKVAAFEISMVDGTIEFTDYSTHGIYGHRLTTILYEAA